MKYNIPVENIEELRKAATRIQKKAIKHGCKVVFEEVDEFFKTETDEDGNEITRKLQEQLSIQRLATSFGQFLMSIRFQRDIVTQNLIVNTVTPKEHAKTPMWYSMRRQANSNSWERAVSMSTPMVSA